MFACDATQLIRVISDNFTAENLCFSSNHDFKISTTLHLKSLVFQPYFTGTERGSATMGGAEAEASNEL